MAESKKDSKAVTAFFEDMERRGLNTISPPVVSKLTDIAYGTWQFRTYAELKKRTWSLTRRGLPRRTLSDSPWRIMPKPWLLAPQMRYDLVIECHSDDIIVLVSHDSVNRALLLQLFDQPLASYWRLSQGPGCVNEIDVSYERIVVRQINVTARLQDNEKSIWRIPTD